ncbi:MAG: DUF2807 domain-containing protein [Pedobacter sp.]|nr:DUF2807 domain-containing protein [Pedobacter sp.]MDQ8051869.1 DUF2807 domain-containing protein [Pedobacter sp.]
MRTKQILLGLVAMLLFTSCGKDSLRADGQLITETRNPGVFHSIEASGSNKVYITYGNEFKIELKGSANLIPFFGTNVVSKVLHLSYNRHHIEHDDIEIYVTMPTMQALSFEGSGDVEISGAFPAITALHIELEGSGQLKARQEFEVGHAALKLKGSNKIDLSRVKVKDADIELSGSGEARLNILQQLNAEINGSGTIYYQGSPSVNTKINGNGKVSRN